MANCSNSTKSQKHDGGGIKWPKTPSEKTMKARKPLSSFDKSETSSLASPSHDSIRSTFLLSPKHKLSNRKNDFGPTNNSGRGPVRWSSSPIEGNSSPLKLEKDQTLNMRQLCSDSVRPSNLMLLHERMERSYENQQKLRKAKLTAPSFGFGTNYGGEWSRAKNRRV